jgi:FkbM family methyltransferase
MQEIVTLILSTLKGEKLYIADVGAAGGPEPHWSLWERGCFFYTFDPDPRVTPWSGSCQNFPIGLWSHKCTQQLHLAAYPQATSLFKPNFAFLDSFAASAYLKEIGTRSIELNGLDTVLSGKSLDFLKVDAEGAELEILKGAMKALSNQCLGLQLEALFSPIRQNAPTFSDLEFVLTQL